MEGITVFSQFTNNEYIIINKLKEKTLLSNWPVAHDIMYIRECLDMC